MLRRNLHADLLKMKGLPIMLMHILIPVIASGLFVAYYSFSGWSGDKDRCFLSGDRSRASCPDWDIYCKHNGTGAECRSMPESAHLTKKGGGIFV